MTSRATRRGMKLYKDMGFVYPFVIAFGSLIWRSLRAPYLVRHLRHVGLLFEARETTDPAADWFSAFVERGYPYLACVFCVAMLVLIGYDFFWYGQREPKNWVMVFHIPFQVFWGLLWFGFAPFLLSRRNASAGRATV